MTLAAAAEYALVLSENSQLLLVTLVARGSINAQIATQLYISVRTVGSHLGPDPGQDRRPAPR